jgi:hypothetical protein
VVDAADRCDVPDDLGTLVNAAPDLPRILGGLSPQHLYEEIGVEA